MISCDLGAGTRGNTLLARGVDHLGIAPLEHGHRADDRQLPLQHELVEIDTVELLLDLADAGQQAHDAGHAAKLLQLLQLLGQIVEIEGALLHAGGDLSRLVGVDLVRRLFDQAHHVAHAENPPGDPLGVEVLEPVELLAGADELDRLAGHRPHRQRRTAAAIAIDAGEHDAADPDPLDRSCGRD